MRHHVRHVGIVINIAVLLQKLQAQFKAALYIALTKYI